MTSYLDKYLKNVPKEKQSKAAIAYLASFDHIAMTSPEVVKSITQELKDQRSFLKLIASENYSSLAVQLSMGNLLTDKYSEGFPFHRFYAGCDNVDAVEHLAVEKLKKIFGCDHAYVQPHSGADANLIAFWAILVHKIQDPYMEKLGKKRLTDLTEEEYEKVRRMFSEQKLMGMALDAGGHLTHGYRMNVSAKMMKSVSYGVDEKTYQIDYAKLQKRVKEEKPLILIAGYSAYPRLINFAKMREIADSVGAVLLVDMAHFAGLVAGKVLTNEFDPVPYAHVVTSTTHKTMRGPRGGLILCQKEYQETVDKGCPIVIGGPMPHVMAAKAVAFTEADTDEFCKYAQQIVLNAKALAETFLEKGVKIITGGTDNHLIMVDVQSSFNISGRQAEKALRQATLTVNRNSIPFDKNSPWFTSGIRLGTPALTTLGMKEAEMKTVAGFIVDVLKASKPANKEDGTPSKGNVVVEDTVLKTVQKDVKNLLSSFPLYPEIVIEE